MVSYVRGNKLITFLGQSTFLVRILKHLGLTHFILLAGF